MLSLKKTLTKILEAIKISYATGTIGAAGNVANCEVAQCRLTKQGKHVTCVMSMCHWNGSTAIPNNTTLFTIPTGYRPTAGFTTVGLCMRYNNGTRLTVSANITIGTDGTIKQMAAADVVTVYMVADWTTA